MDIAPLIERTRAALTDLEAQLADPSVFSDRKHYENLSRDHQRLASLLRAHDDWAEARRQLADNHAMLAEEADPELLALIQGDNEGLEQRIHTLETQVYSLILPPDPADSRDTIVEIRPAAGGDEAALFAGDLLRMYCRFAEGQKWRVEVLAETPGSVGGIKDATVSIKGSTVYRYLRFESGVHRVQRIPETEASGRIHTSTVTVAVLPEAEEVDLQLNQEELRFDVFRSSGPGGQSVNTTDSAVRVTHVPTGISVACQQEKSQHRNRETALRLLRSRLLEAKRQEEEAKYAAERRSQVGTGDRSERIRTYNFPQNRVTDHRYGLSWFNLPGILEGDLGPILDEILAADSARRLEAALANA